MSDASKVHVFRRNVVCAASAGTGKTYLLTSLYVMSALGLTSMGRGASSDAHPPIPPDRIVATTFSRAAAVEIRARVERALRSLASGAPDAPFSEEIEARARALSPGPAQGEVAARARAAVERWHEARIDTLHGLAGDLLRRFALPLGLSPRLRVGEEDELLDIAREAIDDVLARRLEAEGSAVDARALLDACGGLQRVHASLPPFFDRLDEEGLRPSDLATTDHLTPARALRAELARAVHACARDGRPALADHAREIEAALHASPRAELSLPDAAAAPLERLLGTTRPRTPSAGEAAFFALRDALPSGTLRQKAHSLRSIFAEAPALEERERGLRALLVEVGDRMARARAERGLLGFGDLLRVARERLRDHPEVAAEIRSEIDVLLVDEFQDTSRAQRDLVYLLRAERHEAGVLPTAADVAPHGLFLVGDRKQSIYAFRGADVSVFSAMCAELAGEQAGRALDIPEALWGARPTADFVALRESRRSGSNIVDFVNAFAEADFASQPSTDGAASLEEVRIAYTEAERLVARPDRPPGQVLFLRDDEDAIGDPLVDGQGALREAAVAAAAAASAIRERGLAPRDVAVLARRRASIPLVELCLARLGVPYVVAGRALYDTLEVRDLAALVRLVLDPRDRHALAQVLRGPVVALSDAALLLLAPHRGLRGDLLEEEGAAADRILVAAAAEATGADGPRALEEEAARLRAFRSRYREVRATLVRLPPAEAMGEILRAFELDRVMAALPRAEPRLANLDRLASIARSRGGGLLSFSRWLDRQIANEADEAEAVVFSREDDAVRVTTIHASKGLDFEAVVVLDLAAQARPDHPPLAFVRTAPSEPARLVVTHRARFGASLDNATRRLHQRRSAERAQAERRRITYVAMTRARALLTLVGVPSPPAGSALSTLTSLGAGASTLFEVESAAAWLTRAAEGAAARAAPASAAAEAPARRLPLAAEISLATTPLGVLGACARRFRLRFLEGLEEPVASGQLELFELETGDPGAREPPRDEEDDPRALGRAAHRVLEQLPRGAFGAPPAEERLVELLAAEGVGPAGAGPLAAAIAAFLRGPFARSLASPDLELHREEEIRVRLDRGGVALTLAGTVDLFVLGDGGATVDVVDYKLARASRSLDAHAFQLRAYALALARRYPGARVRAGVVFLLSGEDVRWLPTLDEAGLAGVETELLGVADRFAHARATGEWPGVDEPACRAQRCGFITACHRREDAAGPRRRAARSPRAR